MAVEKQHPDRLPAARYPKKTRITRFQGFYLTEGPLFSSRQTADQVVKALIGADLDGVSVDDARARAVKKVEALFSSCLAKQILYRAVRDCQLFWDTIANDFEGYYVLSHQEVRETVCVYADARYNYIGNIKTTNLMSLVNEWIQVVRDSNHSPPPDAFNLAWRPGASGVFVELAQAMGTVSLDPSSSSSGATWPPTHFTEEEVMFLTSTAEFRHDLYAIDSSNHGSPRSLPTNLTQAMEVREFLCWAALVGTPSGSEKALYPNPVAFIDRSVRKDWYRATGNIAMLYAGLDRFLNYAADAFTNRRKTSVTCLFTPWMMGISTAGDLYDGIGDQVWFHPRMVRYGTSITIRLVQQTQHDITQTALELVHFDPWFKYREQLKPKFGGYQVKMMEFNKEVTEMIEEWTGSFGSGVPIVARWWGGQRVGGAEDDAVSMAAAFCLESMRGGDLPDNCDQLRALGFVNSDDF
ncbi:hypothetical protein N0V82_003701 [Gnomoniopsis sp. IMI 355080]|nr:hypothetical protein N0V82_003701 [Gnomoniopsis sp. IMI 355080]